MYVRHVRHGRRRRVAQHALDREDVGGEEVIAEPEGDELVRFDFHASSGTGMAWHASTSASASTSATMLPAVARHAEHDGVAAVDAGRVAQLREVERHDVVHVVDGEREAAARPSGR